MGFQQQWPAVDCSIPEHIYSTAANHRKRNGSSTQDVEPNKALMRRYIEATNTRGMRF